MINKEKLLNEVYEVKRTLIQFLRHPVSEIKNVPDWTWERLLVVTVVFTAVTGVLGALMESRHPLALLGGLILSPFISLIVIGIMCLFFYYCFQIFAERTLPGRKLFTIVLFASFPQFILRILEGFVPPIALIGMAFTALLLLVGFVENFQLDRKLVIKIISVPFAVLFLMWAMSQINSARLEKNWGRDRNVEAPEVELGK